MKGILSGNNSRKTISPTVAYIYSILFGILVSGNYTLMRAYSNTTTVLELAFWRYFVTSIVLWLIVGNKSNEKMKILKNYGNKLLVLSVGMVGGGVLTMVAVEYTQAINVTLINSAIPAFTALVGFVIVKRRLNRYEILGIIVVIAGIVVMVIEGRVGILLNIEFNKGDIYMVLAVLGYAFYNNIVDTIPGHCDQLTLLFLIFGFGLIPLLPSYLLQHFFMGEFAFDLEFLGVISIIAVLGTALPMYFLNEAIFSIGPNRVSMFICLMPFFGGMFGYMFLGEKVSGYHYVGMLGVIFGIYLSSIKSCNKLKID